MAGPSCSCRATGASVNPVATSDTTSRSRHDSMGTSTAADAATAAPFRRASPSGTQGASNAVTQAMDGAICNADDLGAGSGVGPSAWCMPT